MTIILFSKLTCYKSLALHMAIIIISLKSNVTLQIIPSEILLITQNIISRTISTCSWSTIIKQMHQPYNELITDRSDIDTPSSPPAMFASAQHWPRDLITTWVELAFSKLWLTVAGGGARQTENKRFDTYVNLAFWKYSLNGFNVFTLEGSTCNFSKLSTDLVFWSMERYRKESVCMKVQRKY